MNSDTTQNRTALPPDPAGGSPTGLNTPFCGDLRSKQYFLLDSIPADASDLLDPSGHCWCHHTQQPIGPDGLHVLPDQCVPGRACYRSALSPLVALTKETKESS